MDDLLSGITREKKSEHAENLILEYLSKGKYPQPVSYTHLDVDKRQGNYPAPITKETFKGKERGGMNFDENNKKDN